MRFLIVSLLILTTNLFATTLNVPDNFETIQEAIDESEDGDTVLVAQGEYMENINFNGKNISVVGNPDNPHEVIINGGGDGSVVVFSHRESSQTLLSGFTLTNGSTSSGGGIYCTYSSPTLRNLYISDNEATSSGGGLYCTGYQLVLQDVVFHNNSARSGGGIHSTVSVLELQNVSITQNTAELGGGAYFSNVRDSRLDMNYVLISRNSADHYGGIFLSGVERADLNKVTITDNSDERLGVWVGGYRIETYIRNSIVTDDVDLYIGDHAIMWNLLTISYTDLYSVRIFVDDDRQVNYGSGIIRENPNFVDPEQGDYRLTEDSPCIDAGDPNSPRDPDGTRADMGADYYHLPNGIATPDEGQIPDSFSSKVFPNPFNNAFNIMLPAENRGSVMVSIFDINGRKVFQTNHSSNVGIVSIDATNFPTGEYILHLKSDQYSQTIPVSCLK